MGKSLGDDGEPAMGKEEGRHAVAVAGSVGSGMVRDEVRCARVGASRFCGCDVTTCGNWYY